MRLRGLAVVVTLFVAVSGAFAQQSNRATIYANDIGRISSQYFGTYWTGGGSLSLNHFWSPRFSTELAAGAQRDYSGGVTFNRDGSVSGKQFFGYTTYPIDVLAQYHFRSATRWQPYVGAGLHYVRSPRGFTGVVHEIDSQIDGGVVFNLSSRLGIVFDARLAPRRESSNWDPIFRPGVGLSWKF
jgi:outer membrane protein W